MSDELTLALRAMAGDRDDVRTVAAWMMAVNGRLNTIDAGLQAYDDLIKVARAFDGLDGHALCDALEKAFDQLGLYEAALVAAARPDGGEGGG